MPLPFPPSRSSLSLMRLLPCVRLSIHSHFQCNEKPLTPHVFAYVYKILYGYVYPYNHTNMFLGCSGRDPGPWHGLGSPMTFRNYEKLEVFQYTWSSYYLRWPTDVEDGRRKFSNGRCGMKIRPAW